MNFFDADSNLNVSNFSESKRKKVKREYDQQYTRLGNFESIPVQPPNFACNVNNQFEIRVS